MALACFVVGVAFLLVRADQHSRLLLNLDTCHMYKATHRPHTLLSALLCIPHENRRILGRWEHFDVGFAKKSSMEN